MEQYVHYEISYAANSFQKYPVSEDWPYEQARRLFKTPEVTPAADVEVILGIYS